MLAGNDPYSPPVIAEDVLAEVVLTGTASSIQFTNLIASYEGIYNHFQVRGVVRSARADTTESLRLTFNNDTGNRYYTHTVTANGSSVANGTHNAINQMSIARVAGANAPSGVFGAMAMDITDPFGGDKITSIRSLSGYRFSSEGQVAFHGAGWYYIAQKVDSIQIFPFSTGLVAGSRLTLIGIK